MRAPVRNDGQCFAHHPACLVHLLTRWCRGTAAVTDGENFRRTTKDDESGTDKRHRGYRRQHDAPHDVLGKTMPLWRSASPTRPGLLRRRAIKGSPGAQPAARPGRWLCSMRASTASEERGVFTSRATQTRGPLKLCAAVCEWLEPNGLWASRRPCCAIPGRSNRKTMLS